MLERREDDIATTYVWDTSLLSAVGADGAQHSYLIDEQGSPTRLIGEDGLSESYGYDEFGNMLFGTPSATQPFGFTGYQHDSITGTWFAQSREYDSQTGRFTAKDLNRYMNHGVVQSLNQYQYCYANPIRYIDPLGFDVRTAVEELIGEDVSHNFGSGDAIQMTMIGNVIRLDVFVDIQGDTGTYIDGQNVVNLTIQGIENISERYSNVFGQDVFIDVNVHQVGSSTMSVANQNYVPVNLNDGAGRAIFRHATRRGRRGWNTTMPGTVNMFTHRHNGMDRHYFGFENTITHEFFHVFGVGDGYPNPNRGRPRADMLGDFDMMVLHLRRGSYISSYNIQMMIFAIASGEWQNFMSYGNYTQSVAAQQHYIQKN